MANVSRETSKNKYNVIIIGAGLSGSEAAAVISRFEIKTLVINISMDNPAYIKSTNVISDEENRLIKKINKSEKYFLKNINKTIVLQKKENDEFKNVYIIDRKRFSLNYKYFLENQNKIDTRQGLVEEIKISKDNVYKIKLNDGEEYTADYVIVSCGTFFNGVTIFGDNRIKAGRHGEISSISLPENLKRIGIRFERKRTYVPVFIDGKNINIQKGNISNEFFCLKKSNCERYVIHTFLKEDNKKKLNIKIPEFLSNSEKADINRKFTLFPESNETKEYNIDNFICMENEPFQEKLINRIKTLEKVILTKPAYLIEYDGIIKNELLSTFESKKLPNLYFPGEINGTKKYIEIAYQGVLSGADIINKFYKRLIIKIE